MSEAHRYDSALALARLVRSNDLRPTDLVESYLDRIDDRNDELRAYITVADEHARAAARDLENGSPARKADEPLHGVPVAIKDLHDVAGVPTTLGLEPLSDHVPETDSVLVHRLREAGAIVLGKTNTPELAHHGTCDNPLFGPTANPFDPTRTSGGSSGGSAAAVADGQCAIATGTDRSGSIRIPASFCGVYGLKPTFGRIPDPERPDAFSKDRPFDDVGVLTRTVADAAAALDVLAGPHPRDPHSLPAPGRRYGDALDRPVDEFDVAYAPALEVFRIDPAVRATVDEAVRCLERRVGSVDRVSLGFDHSWREMRDAHWTLSVGATVTEPENVEEAYGVDLIDDHRSIGTHLLRRFLEARTYSLPEYRRADVVRTDVFDSIQDVLAEYDLLVTATTAVPAFPHDREEFVVDGESVEARGGWFLTYPFNMTGHPAASAPAGLADGLPVGLQLVGRRFEESTVLAASAALEAVNPWHDSYAAIDRDR